MKIVEVTVATWKRILEYLSSCKKKVAKRDEIISAYEKQIEKYNQITKDI